MLPTADQPVFAIPFFLENGRDLEIIGYCLTREPDSLQKILWLVFMIFVPGLGALIYFFTRVPQLRG